MPNKRADRLNAMAASDAALASNLAVVSTSAGVLQSSRYDVLMGALARLGKLYIVTDPKYGAVADGSTVSSAAIQAAEDDAPAGATLYFPKGTGNYVVDRTINVTKKGRVWLFGGNRDQNGINFTGTGPLVELGSDDGANWDDANYNGVTGFSWLNGSASYTGTYTALGNGLGDGYGVGTYFIRDWRGGNVRIENASIKSFDYWFWGVQSDINVWRNLTIVESHSGAFIGPRSDQLTAEHIWSFRCDRVWDITGAQNCVVKRWISGADGSATINPCRIRNSTPSVSARFATTRIQCGNIIDEPWLESLSDGNPTVDVEAFIEVNVGDATKGGGVVIEYPHVAVNLYSTPAKQHTFYLVKADNCSLVEVTRISGVPGFVPWINLRAVFKIASDSGTTTPARMIFSDADRGFTNGRIAESYSSSATVLQAWSDGALDTYVNNSVGGTGTIFFAPLGLLRALMHNNAAPSSGAWAGGDIILNRSAAVGQPLLWWCSSAGSPGTWLAVIPPTVSGDRGNADVTLTAAVDHVEQRFATALTASRTITLSPTNAYNGARFCVTREATATGAFTLDVGGLKTLSAGQWCEVMYGGSGWTLRRHGTL